MKILFVAPRLPVPADTGGKIRTLNILKQISKWGKVHLVCFSFESWDREEVEKLERDGTIVARLPLNIFKIFPDKIRMLPKKPDADWNMDTHGALARPDGSVVFNFDNGGLVKFDRCGELLNRYDKDEIPEITESRVYPDDYFNDQDRSCYKKD